jgi:sugar/nucleoside kinase (ribokinase family)
VHTTQEFPAEHGFAHGTATMVDADRAEAVYRAVGPATEVSGGSAANTLAGLASFGGRGTFIGRVRDDQLGAVFLHDLRAGGVDCAVEPVDHGAPTGRCVVMVTPDAQRTMCTYLGAASELAPVDLDEEAIATARVLYLEGYLWDQPAAKDAFRRACAVAHEHGTRVAFTLSDPFCVGRHREEFLALAEHEIDVLFANEDEIMALYEVDDFDAALTQVRGHCEIAALTRSELGSVVVRGDDVVTIPALPVEQVVDTTGAGDQYAAGFLFGLTREAGLGECGRLGSLAAAEVITHLGARPETPLGALGWDDAGATR